MFKLRIQQTVEKAVSKKQLTKNKYYLSFIAKIIQTELTL